MHTSTLAWVGGTSPKTPARSVSGRSNEESAVMIREVSRCPYCGRMSAEIDDDVPAPVMPPGRGCGHLAFVIASLEAYDPVAGGSDISRTGHWLWVRGGGRTDALRRAGRPAVRLHRHGRPRHVRWGRPAGHAVPSRRRDGRGAGGRPAGERRLSPPPAPGSATGRVPRRVRAVQSFPRCPRGGGPAVGRARVTTVGHPNWMGRSRMLGWQAVPRSRHADTIPGRICVSFSHSPFGTPAKSRNWYRSWELLSPAHRR